jgi:hypothetical protein
MGVGVSHPRTSNFTHVDILFVDVPLVWPPDSPDALVVRPIPEQRSLGDVLGARRLRRAPRNAHLGVNSTGN